MKADAVGAVERAAEGALTEIATLREQLADREARLTRLRATCAERLQIIETLQEACDERLALIERLSREIKRLHGTGNAEAAADGVDWQAVALEREAALERLSAEAERRSVLLADLTAALHDRTEELDHLRRSRPRTS
jgi:capsule polysaccharide export protein KpsE/RkpR